MDIALPSKNKIEKYYSDVALDYKVFWNLGRNMAIRIGFWDARTKSLSDALRRTDEFLSTEANIRKKDYVLDAGCGVGASAIYLAKTYGCRVLGITLSQKQVDMARENAIKHNVDHLVEFEIGDFHQIRHPDNTFDVVWMLESLSHSEDQKRALSETNRVLKNDGRLIGADYFRSQNTFDAETEELRKTILKGLCFNEFAYIHKFRKQLDHVGYQDTQYFDVTTHTLPSARILNRLSTIGITFGRMIQAFGLRNSSQTQLSWATRYQYIALRDNIHQYRIFCSRKVSSNELGAKACLN